MKRIELRGVIVPSAWDISWMKEYIDKGIITPESKFRVQLAACAGEDVEIYINSPGGSVFAGNELINAIQQHKAQHQKAVHVTIGAMAASMAAVLAVNVADKLSMHRNSKLMFHGAWTSTEGGQEAHADTADLLAKMNADIKAVLLGRYNIAPETVDEWFAEGRAGWITAADARKYGMVQAIVDQDDAPCQKLPKSANNMLMQNGLKIAAALQDEVFDAALETPVAAVAVNEPAAAAPATDTPPDPVAAGVVPAADPVAAAAAPAVDVSALEAQIQQLTASGAALTEQLATTAKALTEAQAVAAGFQSRYDRTVAAHQTELKAAQDALALEKESKQVLMKKVAEVEGRLAKLTSNALGGSTEVENTSWETALASCGDDYAKARQQFPMLFQIHLAKEQKRLSGR
jgi:ATP-dependent protease ClpP protease subunit